MIKKTFTAIIDLLLLAFVILIAGVFTRYAWLHFYRASYPLGYYDQVLLQSKSADISPALVLAVIRTESGFDPNAQSSIPARGLMQLTPTTFEWVRYRLREDDEYIYDDLFDAGINIRYGTELLRLLTDEFDSDVNVLCAYHAGWGSAQKWLQNPEYSENGEIVHIPFSDTQAHVKKALHAKRIYEELYEF